jgi:hypothetical protein
MALKLYLDSGFTDEISQGANTNPDTCSGNGTTGFTSKRQLWLYNDDVEKTYRNIIITAINDTSDIDITYSTTEDGLYTDSLNLADISECGGINDNNMFWRNVVVSSGSVQQNLMTIKHRVVAMEV